MRRLGIVSAFILAAAVHPASAIEPGAYLAQGCAGCHGQDGAGEGAIPGIAGIDRDVFLSDWARFRTDERPATIMNRIARGYTDEEVAALADFFASLR